MFRSSELRSRIEWIGFLVSSGLGVALFIALSVLVVRAAPRNGSVSPNSKASWGRVALNGYGYAGPKGMETTSGAAVARLAGLPIGFEENVGQFAPTVKFLARGCGYMLWMTADGAVLELRSQRSKGGAPGNSHRKSVFKGRPITATHAKLGSHHLPDTTYIVNIKLIKSNPAARVVGENELASKANYFIGSNPSRWRTNVPMYGAVRYKNVYPGVDLVYYGNGGSLEFDFIVRQGANPNLIRLAISTTHIVNKYGEAIVQNGGLSVPNPQPKIRVAANGDLVIGTGAGPARFRKPVVYQANLARWPVAKGQMSGFRRQMLAGRFVLSSVTRHKSQTTQCTVSFALGAYNHSKPVIIDPVLAYSTYLGGSAFDDATGVAVDSSGDVYVTGYTTSPDFPVVSAADSSYGGGACNTDLSAAPCFDAFVTKLNPQGTGLIYSTYLGGSGDDRASHLAIDSSGDAYVVGYTNSLDFPTSHALQSALGGGTCGTTANPFPCYDAFITELSPSGSNLIYSTYLGGQGDDYGMGIAVDSSGSAYVTGFTSGSNFPVTSGAYQASFGGGPYDAFVAKLSPGGSSLVYSTFLGGSGEDRASAIAVDSSGDAYVTGQTNSTNFPTANPFQGAYAGGACGCFDAFIAKLNPTGSALVYSTYLGGTGGDYGNAIALDASDEAFVAGWTTSTDFPVTAGAYQKTYGGSDDAFVPKRCATGNSLVYSTYLGGIDPEAATGIAVDGSGNAYVTGNAYGVGFPAVNPIQSANAGFYDAFIAAFDPSGSGLLYATWLGGSGDDFGNDIAVDSGGDAYVAGDTFSTDFPTTPGAYQTAYAGGAYDGFVAKISPANAPGVAATPDPVSFGDQAVGTTSVAANVQVMDAGSDALEITGVSASGDFAATNHCGSETGPGTSCTVSVTFTPSATGQRTGTLTLSDNAASSPQTINLSGIGTSGVVSLSATSLDFGSVEAGATSATQSVTLTNTATTTLYISSLQAEGTYAETTTCGSTVPAGGSCTISATFQPTAAGASVGQVVITDSAPASPQDIELTGTGTAPEATLAPMSLNFGSQAAGTVSAAQSVTLSNSGTAPLSIAGIAVTGDFSQTNNCGSSLAVGANCAIQVTFSPTSAGTLTGTLSASDNASGRPQNVALSGTGTAPGAALAPASLGFGNQGVGTTSGAEMVTLSNPGNAALSITSIAVSGDFAESNNCGSNLAAGSNCSIQVTFSPTATGTRSGTLAVTDSASGSPQTVALTGTGVTAFSVSANSDATTVTAGTNQATFQLAVSSSYGFDGSVSLACSDVAPASCSFNPASLSPGNSSALTVSNLAEVGGGSFSFSVVATSGSQSVSLPLSIRFADFSFSSSSNSATLTAGGAANYSVNLTPLNGFTGTVNLTCTGAPSAAACTLNPTSANLDGTSVVSVAVSVTTTAVSVPRTWPSHGQPPTALRGNLHNLELMWVLFWVSLLVIINWRACRGGKGKCRRGVALPIILAIMLASCGGGGVAPDPPPADPPGTPSGTYTLTVQGTSGSLSHQVSLTLVVN